MEIRNYRDSDFDAVMSLWNACGLIVPGTDYGLDIGKKMEFQPGLFFVGTISGDLAGTIMAGYDGRRGWLNCLAVVPSCRNMGFGRMLVKHAIERLALLGCVKVNLQVRRTNSSVIEFYRKLGFEEESVLSLGKRLVKTHDSSDR
jgi:ribosomal protein S18 acetylase RimI-like enzyme